MDSKLDETKGKEGVKMEFNNKLQPKKANSIAKKFGYFEEPAVEFMMNKYEYDTENFEQTPTYQSIQRKLANDELLTKEEYAELALQDYTKDKDINRLSKSLYDLWDNDTGSVNFLLSKIKRKV